MAELRPRHRRVRLCLSWVLRPTPEGITTNIARVKLDVVHNAVKSTTPSSAQRRRHHNEHRLIPALLAALITLACSTPEGITTNIATDRRAQLHVHWGAQRPKAISQSRASPLGLGPDAAAMEAKHPVGALLKQAGFPNLCRSLRQDNR